MQGLPHAQISSLPIVHREIKIRADPIQDDTTGKPGRGVGKPVDQDARRATRCGGRAIPVGREGNGRAAILVKRFAAWEAPSLEMAVRQPMQRVLWEAGMWRGGGAQRNNLASGGCIQRFMLSQKSFQSGSNEQREEPSTPILIDR